MKKTEFEKMQRTKMCIDKLANGIDPLTDNEMTDDLRLNDLYISRCQPHSERRQLQGRSRV